MTLSTESDAASKQSITAMSAGARRLILVAAFLGWMFSGVQMAVMTASARSASTEFVRSGQLSADAIFSWERFFHGSPGSTNKLKESAEKDILQRVAPPWVAGYNA